MQLRRPRQRREDNNKISFRKIGFGFGFVTSGSG
jgi:hypothetical protein